MDMARSTRLVMLIKLYMGSETLLSACYILSGVGNASFCLLHTLDESSYPFTCYILPDESSIPFYFTSNGYKNTKDVIL